jgi:hypothetical protein
MGKIDLLHLKYCSMYDEQVEQLRRQNLQFSMHLVAFLHPAITQALRDYA